MKLRLSDWCCRSLTPSRLWLWLLGEQFLNFWRNKMPSSSRVEGAKQNAYSWTSQHYNPPKHWELLDWWHVLSQMIRATESNECVFLTYCEFWISSKDWTNTHTFSSPLNCTKYEAICIRITVSWEVTPSEHCTIHSIVTPTQQLDGIFFAGVLCFNISYMKTW